MNSQHPSTQFTMEIEEEGKLNFLDLTLTRTTAGIEYEIYRKPTHTDTVIPASSNHTRAHRMAAFNSMAHRLMNIPLTNEKFEKEVNTILQIGTSNGYQKEEIRSVLKKKEQSTVYTLLYRGKSIEEGQIQKYCKIPYIGTVSTKLGNLISKETGKKVAYATQVNLGKQLINCKPNIDKNRKSGVYKIECNDCDATYVGQTGRNIKTRMYEHRRDVFKEEPKSAFAAHLKQSGHSGNFEGVKLLHNERKGKVLDSLENICIRREIEKQGNIVNDLMYVGSGPLITYAARYRTPTPPHHLDQGI